MMQFSRSAGIALKRRQFLAGAAGISAATMLPSLSRAQSVAVKGGTLKLGLNGGASTDALDPAGYVSAFQFVLARTWGDTLVETDPETGAARPALAESWDSSEGGKVWSFRIRKGVKFHDGTTMVPQDVVMTLTRHSDKNSKSGALGYLGAIREIKADGDNVVVTLDAPNADLPLILSIYNLVIQPGGGIDAPDAGIGTGPYRIEKNDPGVRTLLTRHAEDWNSARGHVDSVELLVMNDVSARTAALASGRVHLINALNPNTVSMLQGMGRINVINTPGRMHYTMPMRSDMAPFDNRDLRLAMKYAIDREKVLTQVLGGYGTIGNDIPVNAAYEGFPADLPQRDYDPDKALFHFKKSGFDGTIELSAADVMPGGMDMALLLQQSAKAAGIPLSVKRVPQDGYWSNVWRKAPFCVSFFGARLTQDMIYALEFSRASASNECYFDNDRFETLLVEARGATDAGKRAGIYAEIGQIVHDEGGSIIPVFNNYLNAARPELQGYVGDVGNDLCNGYVASRVWLEA